ncbi:endonuclease Q family protein [Nanoarchaeota archaeon]
MTNSILSENTLIADLHVHSKYSRGCSTQLDITNLEKYARIKGVNLLGSGDFTHPKWIQELKQQIKDEHGDGIYKTDSGFPFILQTELSLIYTQDKKGRKVHNVLFAPSFEVVEQITEALLKIGRIDYDGRPIFGMSCVEFTDMLMDISKEIEIIPAHIWTPYFGVLGDKSHYNSIKEAFQENTKYIHAIETGLSSDPPMNWRLSQLDQFAQVSFSDLHSFWPWRIARESTLFDLKELTYKNLINAIRTKQGLVGTIEVDPNYGKYHFDGHRKCNICFGPAETLRNNSICPVCKKPLTIGVLNRVEQLADRPEGFKPKDSKPFYTLLPLTEILSKFIGTGLATKKVQTEYDKILKEFKNEYNILFNVSKEDLAKLVDPKIAEAIILNRQGKIKVKAGYDGEYGVPLLGETKKLEESKPKPVKQKIEQISLSNF